MTRKSLFGSHLYSQIVVPLIVASVLVSVVASIVAVYFLTDLTDKWITQVAGATTVGVVQRWQEVDLDRRNYVRIFATDPATVRAAEKGDETTLRSLVASDAISLTNGSVAVVNSAGTVVAVGGQGGPVLGGRYPGLPATWATGQSLPTVYVADATTNSVTSLAWIDSRRNYALAITSPINDALSADISAGVEGGFSFYTLDGKRLATVVSGAVPAKAADALRVALAGSDPAIQAAIRSAQGGDSAIGSLKVDGTQYRFVVRRAGSMTAPPSAADGYILGAVSQAVSAEAGRTSINLIIIWSTVAVLALVALGFWVARRVSDPLVELAQGARRIADGDFSTKVHVAGGNELAVLGGAFNDMTDSLRERSEALTKKVLELAMLYEMSRALGSTLDMGDLLGSTLDSALRIFDLDVGYIALRDRESGSLEIRAVRGGTPAAEPTGAEAVRSSMAEWVVREGRPLIFNPDPASAEGQIDSLTGAMAALCVPLVSAEGTIGAITVGSSDADYRFNSDDVRLLSTIGNHVTIAVGNIELFTSLQEAYLATVRSLAAAVDAKDTYTRGHSDKVATYATMIAQRMGLSHDQRTALEMAAYLHDIGKIGVPESILLKPGGLTDDEMAQMRHHPLIGANILKPVAFPWAITPIVRHHHEYWDGNGYPAGLKGEEIPLLARILCVADSYEAMTADRPYRLGRSAADAATELELCAGSQFDPRVVEFMVGVIDELERAGDGVLADAAEEVTAEEARAIFAALVDGVLASFRRLGGPRLASNVEADVDEYFLRQHMPFRMTRSRLTFVEESTAELASQLDDMRAALRHVDAMIGRVSGVTLVQHFYDDALDGFSARMRHLAIALQFVDED
jgi:putative nucleotidyltransferase with HDIG domain